MIQDSEIFLWYRLYKFLWRNISVYIDIYVIDHCKLVSRCKSGIIFSLNHVPMQFGTPLDEPVKQYLFSSSRTSNYQAKKSNKSKHYHQQTECDRMFKLRKTLSTTLFKIDIINSQVQANVVVHGWDISCEIALAWMSLDLTDDKSTLVSV